jgi:nucleoid-associated protein YgaU
MDDRSPSNGRDRRFRARTSERPSTRRGYAFPRAEHRVASHGTQARRDNRQMPYVVGFVMVVGALALFLFIGLNWATGPGRAAGQAPVATATVAVVAAPPPASAPAVAEAVPSPSPGPAAEQIYIVKAGDNPATIARQFGITSEVLMAANQIDDPSKLQIGQTLKIPAPSGSR